MREFIRGCEDDFDAIVKLTMVKYLLPKLRNRWGEEELIKQAARRPMRYYQDLHSRGVRGEITAAELAEAGATIERLLDRLEKILDPGPWIVGEEFSLADIAIAPYMFRLSALGNDKFWSRDHRSRVHEWYGRVSARPAFQTAVSCWRCIFNSWFWRRSSSFCRSNCPLVRKVSSAWPANCCAEPVKPKRGRKSPLMASLTRPIVPPGSFKNTTISRTTRTKII